MAKRQLRRILILTREYDGLAGAGGVKDFSRQLAEALARKGKQVSVIMPLYGFMNPEEFSFRPTELTFDVDMSYVGRDRREFVRIWSATINGVMVYLVDAQRYREKRSIYSYTAEEEAENLGNRQGTAHYDYFAMNVLLQKAAIAMLVLKAEKPDIIHCQDGHTAILPAMIREIESYRHYFNRTGCVVTIHNAGRGYHQEVIDLPFAEVLTGLPSRVILNNQLEGHFDPLLAAANYSVMSTVSENYARELQETDDDELTGWLGHKLLEREVVLEGVTNGINPGDYDPSTPSALGLAAAFFPEKDNYTGKARCRAALVKELATGKLENVEQTGFLASNPSQPLFTFIGRLSSQKGVDKMIGALEALLPMDTKFQVAILGTGSPEIEAELIRLAAEEDFSGRICLLRGYDPALAIKIYAAGDFFLVPSRYEPCGLTDFIAQLFGNLPIVHHIGGLVKVLDGETGFAYQGHNSAALMATVLKALELFRGSPKEMLRMRKTAIKHIRKHYAWDIVVERYIKLYRKALEMTGELKGH